MQTQRTSETPELHLAQIGRSYAQEAIGSWLTIAGRSACDPALANVLRSAANTLVAMIGCEPAAPDGRARLELVR